MAILHVRNVPDDLYERLREQADARNRSLSAEVIDVLQRGVAQRRRRENLAVTLERLREIRESLPPVPEGYGAGLIREGRDER